VTFLKHENVKNPAPTNMYYSLLLQVSSTSNSLSKVLFMFPSRYLYAIDYAKLLSFERNLPLI
jgi:hypothetical protein